MAATVETLEMSEKVAAEAKRPTNLGRRTARWMEP